MKIKANLQVYKSKKKALFYIPKKKYEKKIEKLLHKHVVVECVDCKPSVKFVAKIRIIESKGYLTYSIHIPKDFVSEIVKSSNKIHYSLLLTEL